MTHNSNVAWVDVGAVVWVISVCIVLYPSVSILPVLLKLAALCASIFYHGTTDKSYRHDVATRLDFLAIPLWGVAQLLLFVWGDTEYLFQVIFFSGVFSLLNAFLVVLMWDETRQYCLFVFFVVCLLWIAFRAVTMNGFGLLSLSLVLLSALLYLCAWLVSPLFYTKYEKSPWHPDKWGHHCDFHVLLYMADTVLTILSVL